MTLSLAIVLGLLVAAAVMFVLNRPRMDIVGFLMLLLLPLTGVIEVGEALAGFSDPNVLLIASLFVIGEGLVRTGVAGRLGDLLVSRAGSSETRLVVLLMAVVGLAGSVMSSTAIVAIFIPVVLRIARTWGLAAGSLMMPLSMAALISGMMTLVATTPNLVVHGELIRRGYEGFGFFTITPFGLPILGLAIVYMLVARRWLARGAAAPTAGGPSLASWITEYALAGREYRLRIRPGSDAVGQALSALDLRSSEGINIVAIERRARLSRELIQPRPETRLAVGDILFVDVTDSAADVDQLARRFGFEPLPLSGNWFTDLSQDIGMAEVLVAPESDLIGKTPVEARFRIRFGLSVIGIKHGRKPYDGPVLAQPMKSGDTLLVVGPWRAIRKLTAPGGDLIVLTLPTEYADVAPTARRAPFALAALALMVALMVSGIVTNVQAALIACLVMGVTGCIDMDGVYRAIHWRSLMLIVGMLPFSIALYRTGGTDLAADGISALVYDTGPRGTLAVLFVATALMGLFISSTATAILMAPVALTLAEHLQASPLPFAMTVALAASAAFMSPVSSAVNALVVGPGNYSFFDFVRIGVPIWALTMAVSVLLVPIFLPL